MSYILVYKGNITVVEDPSYLQLYLDIVVTDKGKVILEGVQDSINYNMYDYTAEEVIRDFCKHRLPTVIKRLGGTMIKGEIL